MNTADYVDNYIREMKEYGLAKDMIVWNAAMACAGWPYVYSSWGDYCTPSERRKRYRMTGKETIKTKCKGFDSGNCSGCEWYPEKNRVRCYDCRGFTDWGLKQVGIDLYGDTCSTQWNTAKNWQDKGPIGTMPKNTLCCLFVQKDGKWNHTGFGYNLETVECSSGVQYTKNRAAKWTHWAVPAGLYEKEIKPEPEPEYPTLRPGAKNIYVKMMQEMLLDRGYDLGICGADGDYGPATEKAVKQFQKDWGLTQDGICGPKTWEKLRTSIPKEKRYTVTIPDLDLTQAKAICNNYPGSTYREM